MKTIRDFIMFCKCLFKVEPAFKPDPECKHCHGLGYDASGFLCTCVKEIK